MATKKQPAPAEGQALYQVLSNLDHDGKRYAEGDQVALTEEQAEQLAGVVAPLAKS